MTVTTWKGLVSKNAMSRKGLFEKFIAIQGETLAPVHLPCTVFINVMNMIV